MRELCIRLFNQRYAEYDQDKVTILTLLDFSKAFGAVNTIIFFSKLLCQVNFSRYSLLESYLKHRKQCVWEKDPRTIPDPFLFSAFINGLPTILKFSQIHLFASDAAILEWLKTRLGVLTMISSKLSIGHWQIIPKNPKVLFNVEPTYM